MVRNLQWAFTLLGPKNWRAENASFSQVRIFPHFFYSKTIYRRTKLIYGKMEFYGVWHCIRTSMNITEKIPGLVVDCRRRSQLEKPMVGALGWSSDSRKSIARAGLDIWQVPGRVAQKPPRSIWHKDGRAGQDSLNQIRFDCDQTKKELIWPKPHNRR